MRYGAVAWAVTILSACTAVGCGTTQLVAPPGHDVRLLSPDAPAQIRSQRTVWYWVWGSKPISDNTTQEDILKYNLRQVRYTTYQTWFEMMTNPLTSLVSVQRRQIVVEGNP